LFSRAPQNFDLRTKKELHFVQPRSDEILNCAFVHNSNSFAEQNAVLLFAIPNFSLRMLESCYVAELMIVFCALMY
jgi:hypothetical protein